MDKKNQNFLPGIEGLDENYKMTFAVGSDECQRRGKEILARVLKADVNFSLTLSQMLMFFFYYRLEQVEELSDMKKIKGLKEGSLDLIKGKLLGKICWSFSSQS